ncbi:hypothetical protein D1821_19045 (plasmid) [Phaeobacter inhibens]|nr:AAA family ATPase [Phaeobacter inhibens]AXT44582.1 hypothetical protein D1821_19045 [Phaeobacter inhibens]
MNWFTRILTKELVDDPPVSTKGVGRESIKVRMGEETSDALFDAVFDAIARNDHVLLIGPRGSGKSYAARKAINMAETMNAKRNVAPKSSLLVPQTHITAQGNKEMPRDYFFEPEFEFLQGLHGEGETKNRKSQPESNGSVRMGLRQPPLFRFASLDNQGHVDLEAVPAENTNTTNMVSRYAPRKFEHTVGGVSRKIERFVLFLDEINRFNDGVLDSLLLLLEERCVIYQGKLVELPVVVVATMNPPGYDLSARSLSPPLMSRFNIVKQLYTASPKTLVDVILPPELGLPQSRLDSLMYRHFAVAILAFWGEYNPSRPSSAYLSPEARDLLKAISQAGSESFREDLAFISGKSNYGPDARGARDWILAVDRRICSEHSTADLSCEANGRGNLAKFAVEELGDAIANKLVLNFSPEAQPEDFQRLMQALGNVTFEIFTLPKLDALIRENLG